MSSTQTTPALPASAESTNPVSAELSPSPTVHTLEPPPEASPSRKIDVQISKDFGFLPIPKRLRYDPEHPAHFGLVLNAVFGLASTFIVANLYYCQPLLIQLAYSFNVTYDDVSRIPTLVQAGYAVGLVLISPLGDLVRRRPLLLLLVFVSGSLSIGLAITKSLVAFEVLTFFVGVASVSPQILMPFAADLAPPERRASALSIVLAGLLLGILIARVLAGVIAQFVTWRVVYYVGIGMQFAILSMLYLVLPDYPARNSDTTYFGILFSMGKFLFTEPLLVQAVFINIPSAACFTNFWVTLTFLLGGPPYHYSTLVIGLFGLVGMFGVGMAPFVGRAVDGLVPWFAAFTSILALLAFQAIELGAGGVNIAAVVLVTIGLDVFRQMCQVALTSHVFGLDPRARARLNAVLILSIFIGQVMGTSVGTLVFNRYGWRPAAALSVAWTGWMLLVVLVRGPHVPRHTWFGWQGGFEMRKSRLDERERRAEEEAEKAVVAGTGASADASEDGKDDVKVEKREGDDEKRRSSDEKEASETREVQKEKDPARIV